ncbi:ParM/StbA family protein [Aetokthonos hydrillicola Thurmond2011]|jgi:hypothetical protein|uniref:ParM/StbA family protein n=1 Tax=Aetokthonos hydrillicola Thurmond2011 TaxID=2712845 RepID=A0AAP5IA73_9CYAN|nr:ParM/StbA family protein [Aetokthonos hydrillicola]MBO3458481.1 ParM/StbA family protein [Aetokthonos hydrillicola CCALA 1050]MBW4586192.1 ParM/StbA family protein [Aetokthonos hydrillicola CCALA 1050]MDR9897802.1 ParM/StbA family protein [Aetokthonos hydrillicola Thurmond2011]
MVKVKYKAISSPDLVVTIDLGASLTKVIAMQYPKGEPTVLCMEPEVADVSLESLKECEIDGKPANGCWIGLPNGENYAIGFLARYKFGGNSLLKELKYDVAVPKICGLLWVLKEKWKLPNKLGIALAVLLPPSEGSDRSLLETKLKEALSNFSTPTGTMQVKLILFDAMTEGAGILFNRRRVLGEEFKNRTVAVAMIGYRNASLSVVARGVLSPGVSSDFGMAWMIDAFVRRCSGLSKEDPRIVQALVEAGDECSSEMLAKLSRKRKPEEIAEDATTIAESALRSRDDYARALIRWLSQQLSADVDEIIFCGGTAEYLRKELQEHFANRTLIWNGGVEISPDLDTLGMGNRIADVLGLHHAFVERVSKLIKQDNGSVTANASSSATPSTVFSSLEDNIVRSKTTRPKGFLEMPDKL